jgi:autoinducer 2-degrading protein
MHVVLVQFTVRPELLGEFEQAVLANARESVARDPGCLRFDVSQDREDPLTWVLHEVYDREESHQAHRRAPHFLAFDAVAGRAVTGKTVRKCSGRHITA